MDLPNINVEDPAGIQAILDALKASQEWQKAIQTPPPNQPPSTVPIPSTASPGAGVRPSPVHLQTAHTNSADKDPSASSSSSQKSWSNDKGIESDSSVLPLASTGTSVASLLSQLQEASSSSGPTEPYTVSFQPQQERHHQQYRDPTVHHDLYQHHNHHHQHHHKYSSHDKLPFQQAIAGSSSSSDPGVSRGQSLSVQNAVLAQPSTQQQQPSQNLRSCSFQQALPHLARLSEDPKFVAEITSLKKEQAEFEKRLWEERRAIQKSHEEKVNKARTKAKMIGADLTQYEADALTESFRRELQKFDTERVLPAWDGMIAKQQAALESLGVPAMFPTSSPSEREKQQKVMQVLTGVTESL